jgi:hypothetical protein
MILYAASIFLSAFLLFQVQPLIAKIILPWFGGSAAVWSAAMLFFQLLLLAGYGYAHLSIRYLRAKSQMMVHAALLLISCALLPILPSPGWQPTEAGDPTVRILGLLAATIGLPYFLLSSTSPLLQAWYVRRSGSGMPYRLFALSNFGSMLALVSFPLAVEPWLTSHQQAYTWSGLYVLFAALCGYTAWASVSRGSAAPGSNLKAPEPVIDAAPAERPGLAQMVLWIALAACASSLLVSVTNHLSQNVAPIPLLWVVPLALYLGTFILSFESDAIYNRWVFLPLLAPALSGMAYMIFADSGNLQIKKLIPGFAAALFVCCMMCHGELARRRPAPQYLTIFYLTISLGGAIGGIFVAIIAPRVFHSSLELPVGLVVCGILTTIVLWQVVRSPIPLFIFRLALMVCVGTLAGYLVRHHHDDAKDYRLSVRNFYGVLRVKDEPSANLPTERVLMHGSINHGSQVLDDKFRYKPISYYGPDSGVGRAMRALQEKGPVRAGVIGLGAGVLNAYARAGDMFRVYEINPLIERIAQTEFTYFPHSPADKRIMMGDARLTLERQETQQFDILAVDAFSSDAIPIHLLTHEALAVYFRHLKQDGVLALHISNRYLDLAPVCARGASDFGKTATSISDDPDDANFILDSTWVLVTSNTALLHSHPFDTADLITATASARFRTWTDNYSNVVQIFRLQ